MIVVKSIPQTIVDHRIDDGLIAHPCAPPCIGNYIGCSRHVFRTAGNDDVSITAGNGPGGFDDGLHSASADHSYRICRYLARYSGVYSDLAGNILPKPGCQDTAYNYLVNGIGRYICTIQSFFYDDRTELDGRDVFKGAAE